MGWVFFGMGQQSQQRPAIQLSPVQPFLLLSMTPEQLHGWVTYEKHNWTSFTG